MEDLKLYVAADGSDDWSGKLKTPDAEGTDGPLASLARARDLIRELKAAEGLEQPVTVMVREGKYFLDETLVLDPRDSGTQECPIIYKAYPGERPILSGGRKIRGWQSHSQSIIKVEVPWAKGGRCKSRQLFFNGQRQTRARWPKFAEEDPLYGGWLEMEGPAKLVGFPGRFRGGEGQEAGSGEAFKYKRDDLQHQWSKPQLGEVVYFAYWDGWASTVPIKSVDYAQRVITLERAGY
jgi:hypothetical protein